MSGLTTKSVFNQDKLPFRVFALSNPSRLVVDVVGIPTGTGGTAQVDLFAGVGNPIKIDLRGVWALLRQARVPSPICFEGPVRTVTF